MELKFQYKKVYGNARYYPLNSPAKAMVWLKGSKTLVDADIQMLRAAGFSCLIDAELPDINQDKGS